MRIYKGSEITLRLYNPCKIEDGLVDVILYTTNPKLAYKVKDATVEGNIVYVKIDKSTFNNMEDGVINYIILDEVYNTERQSSYYLKTPEDYVAKSVQSSKNIDIVINGDYKILPDEDYSSIEEVNVHVEFDAEHYYQEGYETGKAYQKSKLESVSITENGTYTREDGYNEIHVEVPDLNGDYNEGYEAGKVDGYNRGYDEGETDQKAKLTGITITENGTYSREDGYNEVVVEVPDLNGSYDEGYQAGIEYASENAEEIAAANAIDLVATEFGTYYTKYSDNIAYPDQVTGVFPNGDNFYDYAYTDKIYDTGIVPNANSEIELWFKPDATGGTWGCIISAGYQDIDKYTIRIRRLSNDNIYIANFGTGQGYTENNSDDLSFELKNNIFNHIKFSANGLYVNGVLYNNFDGDFTPQGTFVIDGFNSYYWATGETGYYGMIKITTDGVENVIIPTQDGFMNITTNTILPQILTNIGSRYEYIDNTPIVLDNLIKSVNVQPKIDVVKYGIKLSYCTFTEVPDFYDFEGIIDMHHMFYNCDNLQTIPLIDTSNVTNMGSMFQSCDSLQTIPLIDTSNVTDMSYLFENCKSLQTIPELDTRKVTDMREMFYVFSGNKALISLPKIYCDSCTNMSNYFGYYSDSMTNLTDVGGWINLKINWTDSYGLSSCPNLTYQSCINILNGLYDFTGNGETPTNRQGQLKVHPNFLTTVGDEISIGVAKGWQISA